MSDSANIGRADNLRAGRQTAPNAPHSGGRPGILLSHLCCVQYGGRSKQGYPAPIAKAANNIALSQARATAGSATLNGALVTDGVAVISPPRNIQIDSSNAGDTTQTVTITGRDAVGNAQTEDIASNGTTNVFGNKTFSEVSDVSYSAAMLGNITVGIGDRIGFPFPVWEANEVLLVNENGVATTPVINVSAPGDMGSFTPDTVPDGSIVYTALVQVIDDTESGYDSNPAL